jgi:hypothetical protein
VPGRLPSLENDTFNITIIDWENAGWYPTYWESAISIYACGGWGDDWHSWVGKIMEIFYIEYGWMQMLLSELWS